MYTEYEIRQMPLSVGAFRQKVEKFLAGSGLRMDNSIDYYAAVFRREESEILAGGGLSGNIIKCIAVGEEMREEGFSSRLISHLVSQATHAGYDTVKVFTKPENRRIFESMAFNVIASSPQAILMENGQQGLSSYLKYLRSAYHEVITGGDKKIGVIVMNANPFTLGHKYLAEQAASQVDHLFIIAVKEDVSTFSYQERLAMIKSGCGDIENITVCEGSDYQISQATFPTYFLKRLDDAAETQIALDLDLFCTQIAPALHATIRFVGTEPTDLLTKRYNERMKEILPACAIEVREVERLKLDREVSASYVRQLMCANNLSGAAKYVPATTLPYIIAHLASNSLRTELDTTPKPGLVDKNDNGAHHDMDYDAMRRSIGALHPYFLQLALAGFAASLPPVDTIRQIGMEAEAAMMRATKGVNTHRGALFSMGIAIVAASRALYINRYSAVKAEDIQGNIIEIASEFTPAIHTHGADVSRQYPNVRGALATAKEGYRQLFDTWLPYYKLNKADDRAAICTLLLIMSQIDDTNIYHRKGRETAEDVKKEARERFENFSIEAVGEMNTRYISENISPGGAADMLALTIFLDAVTE